MGVDKKQERVPAMTMAGNQTLPFQFRLVHSRPLVQPILAASFMSTESEKLLEKGQGLIFLRPKKESQIQMKEKSRREEGAF